MSLLCAASGCKVTPAESTARTMSRDLDLIKSPYQYRATEDKKDVERVLRKMPLGETVADKVLRADIESAIASKLGASPKITEIRIFETQQLYRREIWVAEHQGKQLAFDINLQAHQGGGVSFKVDGPVEIHGSL